MKRVEVKPVLLEWALERAGKDARVLERKFPKLRSWLSGELSPTLKQLEAFAKETYTPIGFLFLQRPPAEQIPIPDYRTMSGVGRRRPSADLLDVIYICQQRQEWYRDFERSMRSDPLPFVGSATLSDDVAQTAAEMRRVLKFDLDERAKLSTWGEALRLFIGLADELGVLVMVSGVVGSNNRRKLQPQEFRGFALVDDLAPVVFINGSDTKSAQMFTLAHELVHIWLGRSAVSNDQAIEPSSHAVEQWCNRVAAELLVPLEVFRCAYDKDADLAEETERLARHFKVSTLVILRRIHDVGGITRVELRKAYESELRRLTMTSAMSGGNFYLTQAARVSKRFARALILSTLEGQTLHRDAFRMLGLSKPKTFRELGHSLGVI